MNEFNDAAMEDGAVLTCIYDRLTDEDRMRVGCMISEVENTSVAADILIAIAAECPEELHEDTKLASIAISYAGARSSYDVVMSDLVAQKTPKGALQRVFDDLTPSERKKFENYSIANIPFLKLAGMLVKHGAPDDGELLAHAMRGLLALAKIRMAERDWSRHIRRY